MATVFELREELCALNEQLLATQEKDAAMADGREAAVFVCQQTLLPIHCR